MRIRIFALAGICILTALAAGLLVMGRTDYEVSLDAALEIWADIARDADYIGLTVTRVPAQREMEIGLEIEREILRWPQTGIDPKLQAYVEQVGQNLAQHATRRNIEYRFHVIRAPYVNAFAIPGGGVFITTGMLDFLETEAELAAILGHEISHIDLRHCIERIQYELAARKVVGDMAAIVRIAHELVGVGYSEQQELEADRQGVLLSAAAGYDMLGGLAVFERLATREAEEWPQPEKVEPPTLMTGELLGALWEALGQYFASHPPTAGRAQDLTLLYRRNEAKWLGRQFYVGRSNYKDRVARTTDERDDEWAEYTETPELVDCELKPGVTAPTRADQCLPQKAPDKPDITDGLAGVTFRKITLTTGVRNAQPVDDLTSISLSEGFFYIHLKWALDLDLVKQFIVRYEVFDRQSKLVSNSSIFYAPKSPNWNTWQQIRFSIYKPGEWRIAIYVSVGPGEKKVSDTYLTVLPHKRGDPVAAGSCKDALVKEAKRKDIPDEDKNFLEVLTTCHEAADQGEAEAHFIIGLMHHNGQGVVMNYAEAASWYRLAAEGGVTAAATFLEDYYENGMGVPQDDAEASKWRHIRTYLKDYDENRRGVRSEYAETVKWYHLAADSGSIAAQSTLARMYEAGHGLSQDLVQAHVLLSFVHLKGKRLIALEAGRRRDAIERKMTSTQIADAKAQFDECAESYEGCVPEMPTAPPVAGAAESGKLDSLPTENLSYARKFVVDNRADLQPYNVVAVGSLERSGQDGWQVYLENMEISMSEEFSSRPNPEYIVIGILYYTTKPQRGSGYGRVAANMSGYIPVKYYTSSKNYINIVEKRFALNRIDENAYLNTSRFGVEINKSRPYVFIALHNTEKNYVLTTEAVQF